MIKCLVNSRFAENCASPDEKSDALMVVHLYLCSTRAETNQMQRASWFLLDLCCRELVNRRQLCIDTRSQASACPSLGVMQRKLIQSASSSEELLSVFADVNRTFYTSSTTKEEVSRHLYSDHEMDWFAIEAYNRGVNLTFLGDLYNAERLITFALNFLPYCSDEVKSHGPEMRHAYRGVIERKDNSTRSLAVCSSSTVRLFGGLGGAADGKC